MKKNEVSEDWLQLTTSSQFDLGFDAPESTRGEMTVSRKDRMLPSSNSLFVESLIDQLCRLLERDPKEQRKVYNAICAKLYDLRLIDDSYRYEELSSLRGHYRQALSSFMQPDVCAPLLENSRYAVEYEELEWIASGGFGQVFRARHRLDQVEYAVKKIKVRYKDIAIFLRTLAEVKTLARLNHVNIVQYKAAWLEASPVVAEPVIVDAGSGDASDGVVFQHSSQDGTESTTGDANPLALCRLQPRPGQAPQAGALLFVSMRLCDETLRQWLDRRNAAKAAVDLTLALHIIRQAAAGISYIHTCNVVHHDIKPSNIFITGDMHVQVGDFGLACTLNGGACPVGAGQRGTCLYAAPEQLRGQCHPRSDLFSLGLVLLELVSPFATAMERVAVLNKARGRLLPPELPSPLQELLNSLTAPRADWRPSAESLLEKLNQLHYDAVTCATQADKDTTISELRRLLAERDCEIRLLRKSLSQASEESGNP